METQVKPGQVATHAPLEALIEVRRLIWEVEASWRGEIWSSGDHTADMEKLLAFVREVLTLTLLEEGIPADILSIFDDRVEWVGS